MNAQGAHQNDTSTILAYSALDGFDVPTSLVHSERLPRAEVQSVELFTDGYFKPGEELGVASWTPPSVKWSATTRQGEALSVA